MDHNKECGWADAYLKANKLPNFTVTRKTKVNAVRCIEIDANLLITGFAAENLITLSYRQNCLHG